MTFEYFVGVLLVCGSLIVISFTGFFLMITIQNFFKVFSKKEKKED